MKTRTHLLTGQIVACVLMFCHFGLLGALTGATVMATAGLQAALAIPLGRAKQFRLMYLASLALTPAVCYFTWHGPASVYSSIALATVSIANYQQNIVIQRTLLIGAIFAWVAHNIAVGSLPALISNALALCISLFMLYKTVQANKGHKSAESITSI